MSEAQVPNPQFSSSKLHSQTESHKQKQSSHQQFCVDYKQQVIYPNTIKLIIYTILVYILSIGIDLAFFNANSITIADSERTYLINVEEHVQAQMQSRVFNIKMFVDFYREIAAISTNSTPNGSCNSTRYYCTENTNPLLMNSAEFGYDIVMKNYEGLIQSSTSMEDSEIFLYNPSSSSILSYKLPAVSNYRLSPKLHSLISTFSSSGYLIKMIKKYTSSSTYLIKILLCGRVPSISELARICVISPGDLEDIEIDQQNQIIVINEDTLRIQENSTQLQTVQMFSDAGQNFQSSIAQKITHQNSPEEDKEFYESFDLQNCVLIHKKTQYLIQSKVRICNPPHILNLLSPTTIFIYSLVELTPRYWRQDIDSAARVPNYEINFLIFSNRAFTQRENERMKMFAKKHSSIIQTLIFFISLWLILMPILPLRLVETDIEVSVGLMIKMCKIVKNIKSKDDLEIQIDSFNKLNNEINKRNHIFYSTIQYFKYFIWYRKWLYTTKQSKKKLLLQQGLTLFGSVDQAPVYMYIYQKQIETEAKIAQNYKKMRKIFTQKFILYRDVEKIEDNSNKQRNGARKFKKSGFITEEAGTDNAYSRDFCMLESEERKIEKRINKQLQLMEIQKKSKRYVRFSNDIQEQQKPLQFRVSKFLLSIPSQSNIAKYSQKSIDEQIKRKEDEDIGSNPVQSSRQDRMLTELKEQQSSHSEKQLENWNMFLKFDELNQSNQQEAEDDYFDLRRLSYNKLDEKLCESYENLFRIYEKMINSKKMYLQRQEVMEVDQYMNKFYWMLIEKLRYTYKFIKHKNKQRQKILKTLSKKLINITKQKQLIKQFERSRREKLLGSQKMLQETISVIEEEIEEESKLIDIEFKQFAELEKKYKIDGELMEKARLYQIKVKKTLNYPIPYKKLESLCDSKNEQIRVQARVIMAEQFFYISPHADLQVLARAQENLQENHTTNVQKQKTLKLIKRVLKNRQFMEQEQSEIELIKNYYNYVHKKIYFVVDLSDSYEVFRPTIEQIYKNMNQVDMFQIMNLAMNEILQDMIVNGSELKPSKLCDFVSKFENAHNQANRIRSVASTKIGNKRMAFEKDFNRIICKIEQQDINLSKFVVIMLGGENQTQSKTHEDFESSSAQNRQNYQVVHQEILSKLEKNYFHMILVGFNLKDYQTRQGKLKKYVRHTHDLFEIDLSKPNNESCYKELSKFFSN